MDLMSHLFGFLEAFWHNIVPFFVLDEYEHGVLLRFGKYHKNIEAGFHWKIPFVDNPIHCRNTVTTMAIRSQSLTTFDGEQITIESIVKYKITNARKYLLEVEDSIDAINDITQGKIKHLVTSKTWEELRQLKDEELKEIVGNETKEWGIKIYYITITSLVKTKAYKLINSNSHQAG